MKTNVLKTIVPLAVVVVGLTSAASTSSLSKNSKSAVQWGYEHIENDNSCNAVQQCDENGNFNCKIGSEGAQLYDSNCATPLKRSTLD